MSQKYEFTGETKIALGVTLRRIRALVTIEGVVEVGEEGGWIEKAEKLFGRSLDGSELEDGYSLDGAHDAFRDECSPREYIGLVQNKRESMGLQG